ncbi:MAG: TetR/AcrR family transcriptional regulator [Myxococcales bacterium]
MLGDGKKPLRRDQHSEDTRRAILEAARKAFAEKGYAETSLEDIVAPARLTKGALYHHFQSKAAVLEALYVEMEEQLVTHVQARMANASDDSVSRIEAALDAFLDASSEPAYVRIVLRDAPNVLGQTRGRALDHAIGLDLVLALVTSLREEGMMPDLPIEATARMLLTAASEVVVSMAHSDDPEHVRREGRAVVLAIFEGFALKAQAERSSR